jgi:hypothetical protein
VATGQGDHHAYRSGEDRPPSEGETPLSELVMQLLRVGGQEAVRPQLGPRLADCPDLL